MAHKYVSKKKGLTTSNPFVRLGPNTFEGRYENLLGTEMILEEHTCKLQKKINMEQYQGPLNTVPYRPAEDGKLSLQPWALTASHLRLNPVVLTEKQFEDIDNTAALQVDLGDLVPTKKRGRPKKLRAPDLTGEDVEPAPKAARTGRGRGRGSRGGRGSPSGRGGRGFGGADPSTDASEALPPMTAAPAAAQPDQVEDFGELTFSNDPSHEADDATASQNVQDPGTVHNTT